MDIQGTVVKVETRRGGFDKPQPNGTTENIKYDFDLVTVLVDLDTFEVKVKADQRQHIAGWARGEVVDLVADMPKGTRLNFVAPSPAYSVSAAS